MIITNVFPLARPLRELNQKASSCFLSGGARFYDSLAALEKADPETASNDAIRSLESLDEAVSLFDELSQTIGSDEYRWMSYATREIDFDDAARSVHQSLDSLVVRNANTQIVAGNIAGLIASFAQEVSKFSVELRGFVERAAGQNLILDDEYKLAHRLLRDWGTMIFEGQYISAVCLAAATVPA